MREKLFVIDEWTGSKWEPRYLQRGRFRWALNKAQSLLGPCTRVRRVKTPTELAQYRFLNLIGDLTARTEWVN